MVRNWTRSFRKDNKGTQSAWQWLFAQTDIPHNFGLVIGIKRGVVHPLRIQYPNIAKDEVRTDRSLTPDAFSHIQVPLQFVPKVQLAVQQAGLDIPVVPIEYVALHERKMGVRRLVTLSNRSTQLQTA